MHEPFVSVVINNYNYGRFLKEAIDSALSQDYKNKEIIVVDDGSTDLSRDVIRSYGNGIIAILKENGGQASAMNQGFNASKGDWICFLDSDDVWFPGKISKVMEKAKSNPQAIMIYHKIQSISLESRFIGKPIPSKPLRGNIEKVVLKSGGWWMYPPNSANCFRRDFLNRVMDIPEKEFKICADAYLCDLAPFFGEIDFVDEVLGLYRLHGSNYWNREETLKEIKEAMVSYLEMYEKRVKILNKSLEKFGVEKNVSLENHWPYKRLKFILGMEFSLFDICIKALNFPYHRTVFEKLRALAWVLKTQFLRREKKN